MGWFAQICYTNILFPFFPLDTQLCQDALYHGNLLVGTNFFLSMFLHSNKFLLLSCVHVVFGCHPRWQWWDRRVRWNHLRNNDFSTVNFKYMYILHNENISSSFNEDFEHFSIRILSQLGHGMFDYENLVMSDMLACCKVQENGERNCHIYRHLH
jgi:hypothetical protein